MRALLVLVCTLLALRCKLVEAQQHGTVARIGHLTLIPKSDSLESIFIESLRELGYEERRNLAVEYRRANGQLERLPTLIDELLRTNPPVIVVRSTPVVQAAKNATKTVPLVMVGVGDPVRSGFVDSLAHPGGNITGLSNILPELAGKRLELLKDIRPSLSQIGFLAYRPDPLHTAFVQDAQEAAARFKVQLNALVIDKVEEIENAFVTMKRKQIEAIIVQPLFTSNLAQGGKIADLCLRNRLISISDGGGFADLGGLLFYGPDQKPMFRRAATFVDKILKGAKPADLPVEQPTKFEFIINLKTAKQIGLVIPPNVLARADRVIR
jgi:putative ABC transport system substrate-binding protein